MSIRLPSAYQEVEYIESTGTQYIDTEWYPKSIWTSATTSGCAIEIDACPTQTSASTRTLYGCSDGANTVFSLSNFWRKSNGNASANLADKSITFLNCAARRVYKITMRGFLGVHINGVSVGYADAKFSTTSSYSLYLFANNLVGTADDMCYARMYSCKLYNINNSGVETLARDFIPCYRKSDNEIGLYDLVNDVFYTNQGSGTFLKGKNVVRETKLPDIYQKVSYIETDGTAYINTDIPDCIGTSVSLDMEQLTVQSNYWYGSQQNSNNYVYNGLYSDYSLEFNWARVNRAQTSRIKMTQSVPIDYNSELITYTVVINGTAYSLSGGTVQPSTKVDDIMYIFASKHNDGTLKLYGTGLRCYFFKMYFFNNLIRDYVPCYNKSTGVIGLYDLVTGTFFTNANSSGTFLKGNDIIGPDDSIVKYKNFKVCCGDQLIEQPENVNIIDATGTWNRFPILGGDYSYVHSLTISVPNKFFGIESCTINSWSIDSSDTLIANPSCSYVGFANQILLNFQNNRQLIGTVTYSINYTYTYNRNIGDRYNSMFVGNTKTSKYFTSGDLNDWKQISPPGSAEITVVKTDHGAGYSPARYEYQYLGIVLPTSALNFNVTNLIMQCKIEATGTPTELLSPSCFALGTSVVIRGWSDTNYISNKALPIFFSYRLEGILTPTTAGSNFKVKSNIAKDMTSCSVSTGGRIQLPNGDFININEYMGVVGYNDGNIYGIEFTLDSGHNTIAYSLVPDDDGYTAETAYGCFYDADLYDTGQVIKIYDIDALGDYNDVGSMLEGNDGEPSAEYYGAPLIGIIALEGSGSTGTWKLKTGDTKYSGNTVTLLSGEKIFVSGMSYVHGEVGIYFTRDSGDSSYAYYKRNGVTLQETQSEWFGGSVMIAEENDIIVIYDNSEGIYSEIGDDYDYDFSESTVSQLCPYLCRLKYVSNRWIVDGDESV